MHRRLEWDEVTGNHTLALNRLQNAQQLYEEAMKELKPGEKYPGISEVMIRYSRRQKYRKILIHTPRLNADYITFTNGKGTRVYEIETRENPLEPFLWITAEPKPAKKKRLLLQRWKEAGIDC